MSTAAPPPHRPPRRPAHLLPRSLQGRLLALVLGTVLLLWAAAAWQTARDARHELDELLDSHLAQAAALLVVQQTRELGEHDDGDELDAPVLHRYAPRVAFQVFHEGRLVLRSSNAPAAPLAPVRRGYATVRVDGTDWRVFATTGAERDVQVYVGEQLGARHHILWAVLRSLLLPLAVSLPVLALALWWAVHRGFAPLRRLSGLVQARSPAQAGPVVLPGAPSELQPLVDALNGLFDRVAALLDGERRFTADAAHELRTPIAAIRAQAQVALAEADAPERERALRQTLAGCDRATRLVEQLLTLSRLEAGEAAATGAVDLAAIARQEVAALAPAALDAGQTVELLVAAPEAAPAGGAAGAAGGEGGPRAAAVAPAFMVRGDATLLAVLVRNLVDNALRYGGAGVAVQVALEPLPGGGRLVVRDSGPGLPQAALQRLGERFYRAEGSTRPGSGLGWSIVRRIAAVHGAQVTAKRSTTLGGLEVTVAWPGAAAAAARVTAGSA